MSSIRPNAAETAGSVLDVPRPLRPEVPDGFFHVAQRGVNRCAIFRATQERLLFVTLLEAAVQRFEWILFAYCLMTNHFHLVFQTPKETRSRGMQWLTGVYGLRFNHRHGRTGHLFQGRFGAVPVESDEHLLETCRYVVLNPVRAGICSSAGRWRWSSYAATAGLEARPAFLSPRVRELFGSDDGRAALRYRAFIRDAEDPLAAAA